MTGEIRGQFTYILVGYRAHEMYEDISKLSPHFPPPH